MNLGDFSNCFSGQNAVVVASGPTNFEYPRLSEFQCPVFLVNDTIRLEHFVQSEHCFFFSHHPYQFQDLVHKSVFFYPLRYIRLDETFPCDEKLSELSSSLRVVFHDLHIGCNKEEWRANQSITQERFPVWCLDRGLVVDKNALFGHTGSITSLIHFLWFCGIQKVRMIGCCPHFYPYHRHDTRLSALSGRRGSLFDLAAIIPNQIQFLEFFGVEAEYIADRHLEMLFL